MDVLIEEKYDVNYLKKVLDQNSFLYKIRQENGQNIVSFDDLNYIDFIKLVDKKYIKILTFPYDLKKVTRINNDDSIIECQDVKIGGKDKVIIAGPCAVENYENTMKIAKYLKALGIKIMRAGAYKPRTNPYSFQGLKKEGLEILKKVKEETGILIASEITDINDLDIFLNTVDIIQVGARNMQNFALLKSLGHINKPIILKRGFNNSIEELLCAAEYILLGGNKNVILCERGIRTPLSYTRNTLDICAIPVLKRLTHLPVIVDPSHATGKREIVNRVSLAALVAGADGLIIETHFAPNESISDAEETISLYELKKLLESVKIIDNL